MGANTDSMDTNKVVNRNIDYRETVLKTKMEEGSRPLHGSDYHSMDDEKRDRRET